MNIYRKKSTNSQSSFAVLDESQEDLQPKSACSIGCDPIFEWKSYTESSASCDIAVPIDRADLDDDVDKENQGREFWKRAVAARQELTDELNESADEISFRSFALADEALENQCKWDRFYWNSERARKEKEEAAEGQSEGETDEEVKNEAAEPEEESEEEESEGAVDEDEEEEHDHSYQRLNESDDQESEE
ncbi:hypothetical protein PENTCL1PPCAC_13552 [Pristionchus entomophagus]|uniref:Uncharacterized protein n=1 Tax=Pristionchus entomophagus TaxID=358040 RepID=A0AAV5T724_9BILA|nr:hypothetical protein PENTCL1PPCAC_13552 [Pristionchus entomophagus]